MKVSYNILKKFVTPPREISAKDLAETLTMSTVEVEEAVSQSARLDKVVLGKVIEINSHPNADKLRLAKVDIGADVCEVVCGGVNLKVGMKVALARVGAQVRWHGEDKWTVLESAKIRGVESNGMICAAEELGLEDSHALEHGIMDLSPLKAAPGTPLAEALEQTDIILDIDNKSVTHRPDLWGHLGLARELAAIWGLGCREPKTPLIKPGKTIDLKVKVEAKDRLVRYLAVAVEGVKVGPSPEWLVKALASLGSRSINNVVDVTNYILFELGQPLHAFDLAKLASPEIIVRTAKPGETITTLDGVKRELKESNLLIADVKKPIALAGIMGDEVSGVSETTTKLVFESATFDPINIRQSETALNLRTEASIRFEKSLDPNLAELALRRAVELLSGVCPSAKVASQVVDVYVKPLEPAAINLPLGWLNRRIGMELPLSEVKDILQRLGFKVEIINGVTGSRRSRAKGRSALGGQSRDRHEPMAIGSRDDNQGVILYVTPPSWRATRDITIPEDLIEEVARIHGYGNIPLSLPKFAINPPERDQAQELRWKIRDLLVGTGWNETVSYSFTDVNTLDEFGFGPEKAKTNCFELENPIDSIQRYLRPTLLVNLSQQLITNFQLGGGVKLFEMGRVFEDKSAKDTVENKQSYSLGLAINLSSDLDNFGKLKGALELIGNNMGVVFVFKTKLNAPAWADSRLACGIFIKDEEIGYLAVSGGVGGMPVDTALAEIKLDLLSPVSAKEFKSIPKYPAIGRDLTVTISNYPSDHANWKNIEEAISKIDKLIESVEYVGYFAPKNALTFRLTFRSSERTLKSEEVEVIVNEVVKQLINKFDAVINS